MPPRRPPARVRLDLRRGQLLRGKQPVRLRPKTWSVLLYLAERPGILVSKEALLDALWPDVAVTEETLSKSISELRAALGDDSRAPRFLETVNRRGYRFLADLLPGAAPAVAGAAVAGEGELPRRPFVGREPELARLATGLAQAQAGEPQIVFVSGPAGIGKTALVDAFLASPPVRESAARVWIARAGCFQPHGPEEPLRPLFEALEYLARRGSAEPLVPLMRRAAPMWLVQMPWLIGDAAAAALRRALQGVSAARMPRELAALVDEIPAERTLVLVLEDLHWSDPATIDALALLARRPAAQRLLVIGTYRPAEVAGCEHSLASVVRTLRASQQCVELPLHDLGEDAVCRYLAVRFPGSDFPVALAHTIHAHTGGHPLFLVAVVDHLLSRGWILDTAPGWRLSVAVESIDLGVPDDARQMIETQLQQRSPAEQALLEVASVAGGEITARVAAAALGWEVASAEHCCETLARARHLLEAAGRVEWPDGSTAQRYRFTHELYRQVVYEAIADERRGQLHQRVGESLEVAHGPRASELAAQLAAHFQRGGDVARAQRHLTAAGRRARQHFASREAIACFETALAMTALLPQAAERQRRELEVRLALGRALADAHGFASEPVRANYERVSELCATTSSARDLFEALYARWYVHALRGQRRETMAMVAELQDLARRLGTADEGVLADSALVRTALYDGRLADAELPMASLRAREAERRDAPAADCYGVEPVVAATMHYANTLWFLGDTAGARATARAGLARARASGNPLFLSAALGHAALTELFCGNSAEGGELAEEGAALAAEQGFAFWQAFAAAQQGWALVQQGQATEGSAAVERALAGLRATGTGLFLTCVHAFLAEGRLRAGAPAAGLAAVDAGLALAEVSLGCSYEPELWRLRGELLLASAAAWPAAEGCLLRALELARAAQARSLELRAATTLAREWRARDRAGEAYEILRGICDWFAGRPEGRDLGAARALLTRLAPAASG